jgi:hypothetical protein
MLALSLFGAGCAAGIMERGLWPPFSFVLEHVSRKSPTFSTEDML